MVTFTSITLIKVHQLLILNLLHLILPYSIMISTYLSDLDNLFFFLSSGLLSLGIQRKRLRTVFQERYSQDPTCQNIVWYSEFLFGVLKIRIYWSSSQYGNLSYDMIPKEAVVYTAKLQVCDGDCSSHTVQTREVENARLLLIYKLKNMILDSKLNLIPHLWLNYLPKLFTVASRTPEELRI
jgi:hypothetical protein